MINFWQDIQKPILALAPMEDVTDTVFREIVLSVSNPQILSVLFTEFVSTDGLCHEKGRYSALERLTVSCSEQKLLKTHGTKLVAQIWGNDPEKFFRSARMICDMGLFNGIDINMGCPVKNVIRHGSCSALIANPKLAREIIQATKEGSSLPVSVKTRIGIKTPVTEEWMGHILEAEPAAITLHGRTQKMMSKGAVRWDEIARAVQLRNQMNPLVKIIGNGDVTDYTDALKKSSEYALDGIMIGRGVFRNPWVFNHSEQHIPETDKIDLLEKHVLLFESIWDQRKNFAILKRFFKIYMSAFSDASDWRGLFMKTNNYREALNLVTQFRDLKTGPVSESERLAEVGV